MVSIVSLCVSLAWAFSSDRRMKVYSTEDGKVASQCNNVAMMVELSSATISGDQVPYFGGVSFLVPSSGYTTRGIVGKYKPLLTCCLSTFVTCFGKTGNKSKAEVSDFTCTVDGINMTNIPYALNKTRMLKIEGQVGDN